MCAAALKWEPFWGQGREKLGNVGGEGRLVESTVWDGFGSRRRKETVKTERSQWQLRLVWLGHSGAFPPLKYLSVALVL